jgi:YaiO family outer membrane protein
MKNPSILSFKRFVFAFACIMMFLPGCLLAQDTYEALHEQGKVLYRSNQDLDALKIYMQILDTYPDDADALLFRGRLYARLKLYDAAENDLLRVIELAPDYLDAYHALASVYFWRGDPEQARIILSRWMKLDLENPEVYVMSAQLAIEGRRYAAARTFLEEAAYYGAQQERIESLLRIINTPNTETRWSAGVQYEYVFLDTSRSNWQQLQAHLTHDFGKVLVRSEINRYQRYGADDYSAVIDAYIEIGKKSYLNSRIQAGMTGAFMPAVDLTLEMFVPAGTRNEPAFAYRLMHFDSTAAHIPSVAWAAYPDNWYLRDKVSLIINDGISWQNQLTIRYLFENVDTYIQLMNVIGTDMSLYGNEWVQSISFALSTSVPLSDHILMGAVVSWTRDEFKIDRIGASAGLTYKW